MTKRNFIIIMLAAMPSYFSLFCAPIYAVIMLSLATIIAIVVTSFIEPKEEKHLADKALLGWCIHLVGICINVAFHNLTY